MKERNKNNTFKPNISSYAKRLPNRSAEEMFRDAERRKKKREMILKQKERDMEKVCTFKPKLSEFAESYVNFRPHVSTAGTVEEYIDSLRLFQVSCLNCGICQPVAPVRSKETQLPR